MNKVITCLVLSSILFISCKKEVTKPTTEQKKETVQEITYSINTNASEVHWTAYKTTAKKEVKGVFTKLNITNQNKSNTKLGVFDNLSFDIPVSSFFSKNEARDTKIKTLFFGVMENTALISGTFSNIEGNESEGRMVLNLTMNNETVAVPLTYNTIDNTITLNGTIKNLLDWKMGNAFNSLHKACELLHTGEDGVSKTWQDVALNAVVFLN